MKDTQMKGLLDPQNSQVILSAKQVPKFYIFLSVRLFLKCLKLELRSLGQATDICVGIEKSLKR